MDWLIPAALGLGALALSKKGPPQDDLDKPSVPFPTSDSILKSPQWAKRWATIVQVDPLAWVQLAPSWACIMTPSRYVAMHTGGLVTAGLVQHTYIGVNGQTFQQYLGLRGAAYLEAANISSHESYYYTLNPTVYEGSNTDHKVALARVQLYPKCDLTESYVALDPYQPLGYKPPAAWPLGNSLADWPVPMRLELWRKGIFGPARAGVVRKGVYLCWVAAGWWPTALDDGGLQAFVYWLTHQQPAGKVVPWAKMRGLSAAERVQLLKSSGWKLPKGYLANAGDTLKGNIAAWNAVAPAESIKFMGKEFKL